MAKKLTVKQKIEVVRSLSNPDIIQFIAAVDAATTKREVSRLYNTIYDIPEIRNMEDVVEGGVGWTLMDLCHAKESEINRAEKDAAKEAREDKKNAKDAEKEVVQATYRRYVEMPILKTVLDQVTVVFHKQIYNSVISQYTPMIERYFTDGKFNLTRPDFRLRDRENQKARERYDRIFASLVKFMLTPTSEGKLSSKHQTILDQLATSMADEIVDAFRFKLAMKLGAVIDRKGDAKIVVRGHVDSHTIDMMFPDGSSFYIKTQQVLAVSSKGTLFARYPTTFHDVRFADGSKMATPSAAKLQEEFGINADLD